MKKLFILAGVALSLTLFSFVVAPASGVVVTGKNQYEIASANKVTDEDNKQLLEIIKSEYSIKDFGNCSSTNGVQLAAKGSAVEWYVYILAVIHRAVTWEASIANNPNLIRMDAIYKKYVE